MVLSEFGDCGLRCCWCCLGDLAVKAGICVMLFRLFKFENFVMPNSNLPYQIAMKQKVVGLNLNGQLFVVLQTAG